jgi:hypothetical protein
MSRDDLIPLVDWAGKVADVQIDNQVYQGVTICDLEYQINFIEFKTSTGLTMTSCGFPFVISERKQKEDENTN